jgi:ATP sulfurylase
MTPYLPPNYYPFSVPLIMEFTFRDIVKKMVQRDDAFIVCSYSRTAFSQTGDGHFSPIGGYHPEQDMVLMLDTARFKYPPHWVPLPLLWDAMLAIDRTTGKTRGFSLVQRLDTLFKGEFHDQGNNVDKQYY